MLKTNTIDDLYQLNRHFYAEQGGWDQAERDYVLLLMRVDALNKRNNRPGVGDFLHFSGEETLRRFTYHWGDSIQTTCPALNGDQSFYFSVDGFCDYSGSLDPSIPTRSIRSTNKTKLGLIWFFSGDCSGAHRGVYAWVEFRVYEYNPTEEREVAA